MIFKDKNGTNVFTSFESPEEMDLYYSLRDYLNKAGVEFNTVLLHRYCKLNFQWIDLFKKNPKHYLLDKFATHLQQLEDSLCLNPKSLLAYKKDKTLTAAKQMKIREQIQKDK